MPGRLKNRVKTDAHWMNLAIHEATRGSGTTSPNPIVGALVVYKGNILSKGAHLFAGGPHAEVVALRKLKKVPSSATLYTTLEPCSTQGRTPACTEGILRSGIQRVVIGSLDPNPRHRGRGVAVLRARGLRVTKGVAEIDCANLNPGFAKYITQGIPLGIAKMALSLDGRIAAPAGKSRWISCRESRKLVQKMRHASDAILVGAGTVRRDNPRLTLRESGLPRKRRAFVRIVADSKLSISSRAKVLQARLGHVTWIATTAKAVRARGHLFQRPGVTLLTVHSNARGVSIRDLFFKLGERQVTQVLIEGGPTLLASCLKDKVVDKLALFIAPKLLGGRDALGPVGVNGVSSITKVMARRETKVRPIGTDLLLETNLRS